MIPKAEFHAMMGGDKKDDDMGDEDKGDDMDDMEAGDDEEKEDEAIDVIGSRRRSLSNPI